MTMSQPAVDLNLKVDGKVVAANPHSLRTRFLRVAWGVCYTLLYRTSPRPLHRFRIMLLRAFGADVDWTAHPYPKCRIWAPWNLKMGKHSCLANDVDCYNAAPITIGEHATVSQYAFLCTASHDYNHPAFPYYSRPIEIQKLVWVAARAYIGPGVVVADGAVVGANSCVYKSVDEWTVVAGNPARPIGQRVRLLC